MLLLVLFPLFVLLLFFLSRQLSKSLSQVFFSLTKSHKATITLLALFFLPGVVVHELSHLLSANLLFVRTGLVEFFPQVEGNTVKLGSVAVEKTDPLRRFIIGSAPLLVGSFFLSLCFWYLKPFSTPISWSWVLFAYILFEIGNTMFSSKKDMEGGGFLLAIVFFIVAVFVPFLRQKLLLFLLSSPSQQFFMQMNKMLLLLITIDLFFYILAKILLYKRH
jgi:hypothetical protein